MHETSRPALINHEYRRPKISVHNFSGAVPLDNIGKVVVITRIKLIDRILNLTAIGKYTKNHCSYVSYFKISNN